ncbi:MAG: hypothetical protein RBG13Loki_4071 [Promethearchaeota archaeon CR_4]|nr:MAG: hypothetical protein RBG13Loki_4071 [Candidatus Lokiarchaeota archaeon CR_4]
MTEITYEGKKYRFSTWSLVLFPIGTIIGYFAIYYITEAFGVWIHWFVAEQTAWLLRLFGVGVNVVPVSTFPIPSPLYEGRLVWWQFEVLIKPPGITPYLSTISFTHDCSGFQAIAMFLALILFIPHSQDMNANRGIWRRKTLSIVVSTLLFHVVNVLRMVIQLSLYAGGANWDDIHYSISAASSIIAVLIIVLMNRWVPEFILSIMVIGKRIGTFFKGLKKNRLPVEHQLPDEKSTDFSPENNTSENSLDLK